MGQNKRRGASEAVAGIQKVRTGCTLVMSRVGDVAIDLPDCTVIIQASSQFGSRRQEAQRLGRVLRPKMHRVATSAPNAYFYSLYNKDSRDAFHGEQRQHYLMSQGYSYRAIHDLLPWERMDLLDCDFFLDADGPQGVNATLFNQWLANFTKLTAK